MTCLSRIEYTLFAIENALFKNRIELAGQNRPCYLLEVVSMTDLYKYLYTYT